MARVMRRTDPAYASTSMPSAARSPASARATSAGSSTLAWPDRSRSGSALMPVYTGAPPGRLKAPETVAGRSPVSDAPPAAVGCVCVSAAWMGPPGGGGSAPGRGGRFGPPGGLEPTQPRYINPGTLAALPGFTHAVRVGATLYISGEVALDSTGQLVGPGDVRAQARQAFANLAFVLKIGGATPADVAKLTI